MFLSQQAHQAQNIPRSPPPKRICTSIFSVDSDENDCQGPLIAIASMVPIIRDDTSNSFVSLGWGDVPVEIYREAHPSTITISSASAERMTSIVSPPPTMPPPTILHDDNANDDDDVAEETIQIVLNQHKRKVHPSHDEVQAVTTFGWGDFIPLFATDETAGEYQEEPAVTVTRNNEQPASFGWSDFPLIGNDSSISSPVVHVILDEETTIGNHRQPNHRQPQVAPLKQKSDTTRGVQFSFVHIREHSVQLGDHPLCNYYPVSLDWTFEDTAAVSVNDYEEARANCCWDSKPRRMDVVERRSLLANSLGISKAEVDVLERYRRLERYQREKAAQTSEDETPEEANDGPVGDSMARVPTVCNLHDKPLPSKESAVPHVEIVLAAAALEDKIVPARLSMTEQQHEDRDYYFQENFLEMSMHISSHAVHPGFETQIQ